MAAGYTASIAGFSWGLALLISGLIEGASVSDISSATWWFLLSVGARGVSLYALDSLAHAGGAVVKSELRQLAMRKISESDPSRTEHLSSAEVTTLLSRGIDSLDAYFGRYLPQLLLAVVQTPALLLLLWWVDLPTGIAITLALPVVPVFMVLIGWATQAIHDRQWQGLSTLAKGFLEIVEGLPTLKLFGRHWRQVTRIREVTRDYRQRTMAVLRVSFLSGFVLELAASLSVAIVAVSVGIRLIDGTLPLWLGLFVLILVPEVYIPLRQVGVQFHQSADGLAAAGQLFPLLEGERDSRGSPVPWPPSWDATKPLELEGFHARRGGKPVHVPLSGRWESGQIVLIEGPSGSGKSSLIGALGDLVPAGGEIRSSGKPINLPSLRDQVAWVPQDPQLVAGRVDHNVALGDQHPQRDLVAKSMALAAVEDVSPDAVLGVHGAGLSGGQAQRVALARAYYRHFSRHTPLLLLDEVTSALDAATEERVWAGMRAIADSGALVVVVSHRPAPPGLVDLRVTLTPQPSEVAP